MSAIQIDKLKSVQDSTIPFWSLKEAVGTEVIKHDSLLELGCITKSIRIINNDNLNVIKYKLHSPSGIYGEVPPNSDETIVDWTSYLEIVPDGTTGKGIVERDVVESGNAYR